MDYKKLWIELIKSIEEASQTNFGKNQIINKMKELELDEARKELADE